MSGPVVSWRRGDVHVGAADVHYPADGGAHAALIVYPDARCAEALTEHTAVHTETGIPVISIAKTAFRGADHAARVLRGRSARPLLVTAAGMSQSEAAELLREMAGPDRLPLAVRRADRLCRSG